MSATDTKRIQRRSNSTDVLQEAVADWPQTCAGQIQGRHVDSISESQVATRRRDAPLGRDQKAAGGQRSVLIIVGLMALLSLLTGVVCWAGIDSGEAPDGKALVSRAHTHFRAGEYREAIEIFDQVLTNRLLSKPSHLATVHAMRGSCWTRVGESEKAIQDFTDGIRLDDKQSDNYFGRGIVWDELLELDRAIEDYSQVIRLVPKHSQAYCNRGGARFFAGDYDNALADLNEAIRLNPNDAIAYNTRAWVRSMQGEFAKAGDDWARAAQLVPHFGAPWKRPRLSGDGASQQVAHFMHGDFTAVITLPQFPGRVEVKEPKGEFATIDVKRTNAALRRLLVSGQVSRKKAIKVITSTPQQYAPPALYAAADAMFRLGEKEEALFWFFLAQARAGSDAMKCGDASAHQAVSALNMRFGQAISEYAYDDLEKLKVTIEKVVAWDRKHTREYDPKWIALHGMEAMLKTELTFEPEQRWAEIDEQRRTEYVDEIQASMRLMEECDQDGDGRLSESERAVLRKEIERLLMQEARRGVR